MISPFLVLMMLFTISGHQTRAQDYYNHDIPLSKLLDSLKIDAKEITISVSKSRYELTLWTGATRIKSYPVVFGFSPVKDKLRQGDGCTPEGIFRIKAKYPHKLWSKFIWIDYPTAESWQKHREAVRKGLVPARSKIGGEIGIHGVPKGTDSAIDRKINWTSGCISMKNKDINEIFEVVAIGTTIEIQKGD